MLVVLNGIVFVGSTAVQTDKQEGKVSDSKQRKEPQPFPNTPHGGF